MMAAERIPIILDCDPGHDDAVALLLAAASPALDLRLVTVVAGNQTLDRTVRNALSVLTVAGATHVPVAAGADRPLVRPRIVAGHIHGASGLDGPAIPEPGFAPSSRHAVDLIIETIMAGSDPITLIPVGPLTNI